MLSREKCKKDCINKIIILIGITILAEAVIWYAMVREESVSWITSHIMHNPWHYAVTEMDDGRLVVNNVVNHFEIVVPAGWSIEKTRHPSFYLEVEGEKVCKIDTSLKVDKKYRNPEEVLDENKVYEKVAVGNSQGVEKNKKDEYGNIIRHLRVPLKDKILDYDLYMNEDYKNKCGDDFESIKDSFIYNLEK